MTSMMLAGCVAAILFLGLAAGVYISFRKLRNHIYDLQGICADTADITLDHNDKTLKLSKGEQDAFNTVLEQIAKTNEQFSSFASACVAQLIFLNNTDISVCKGMYELLEDCKELAIQNEQYERVNSLAVLMSQVKLMLDQCVYTSAAVTKAAAEQASADLDNLKDDDK